MDTVLGFLHFYFKWEIYESVIFRLHISQTENILWKSALTYWSVPYNLKVNEVCPFCAFCHIVPMEIISGAFSISRLYMNLCRQENVHRKRNVLTNYTVIVVKFESKKCKYLGKSFKYSILSLAKCMISFPK